MSDVTLAGDRVCQVNVVLHPQGHVVRVTACPDPWFHLFLRIFMYLRVLEQIVELITVTRCQSGGGPGRGRTGPGTLMGCLEYCHPGLESLLVSCFMPSFKDRILIILACA